MMNAKQLAVFGFSLSVATIAVADTMVATVSGVMMGYGDDRDACCAHMSTLHPKSGSSADMDKSCRALRGNVVKNIRRDPGGYCRAWPSSGGGYKLQCDAAALGDCYKWD